MSNKIRQFYTSNGIIRLKLVKNCSVKTINNINDLKDLFPDNDVDNLVSLYSTLVVFIVAFHRQVLI